MTEESPVKWMQVGKLGTENKVPSSARRRGQ